MKRIELCLDRQVSKNLDRILDALIEDRVEHGGEEASDAGNFDTTLVAESAGDRRLLEFFQHQKRSLARTTERFRAPGSVQSFRKATLLELEKWLLGREATSRVEKEAELYLSGAIVLMRSHEPFRRFLPSSGEDFLELRHSCGGEALDCVERSLAAVDDGGPGRALSEARVLILRAQRQGCRDALVWRALAWWEWFWGDGSIVESHFRESLRHARNHQARSDALNNLALYLNENRQFREAEAITLGALELGGSTPAAAINAAIWSSLNGHVDVGQRAMRHLSCSSQAWFSSQWPTEQMFRVVDVNADLRGVSQSRAQSVKDDLLTFVYGDME